MQFDAKLCILGAGNIGRAIASGLVQSGRLEPSSIILTRRKLEHLDNLATQGFHVQSNNRDAVRRSSMVLIAVEPGQLDGLLDEISADLAPESHLLLSVVSGASIDAILSRVGKPLPVVRAMPNTAIALSQSMTCLASNISEPTQLQRAVDLFDSVGRTMLIDEELMVAATALCACGTAFFLRAVRAASQGGIEIGFHPREAVVMAAQTALGAASLVLRGASHPEGEIDNVTTPRGCTIAGLNEMEHQGFSSALIKGITTSARKAGNLYDQD